MEFSVYKQNVSKEKLVEYLTKKEMEKIGVTKTHTKKIRISGVDHNIKASIEFYFKLNLEESAPIDWANYWGGLFQSQSQSTKAIESAFGVITIELEYDLYVISLGRGHGYANKYANLDFGIDVAEKIYDENMIDTKSSKYFTQSKNKALTQYNANSYVTSEIGESNELLISKIKIKPKYARFLLYTYKDKLKFGSSIKIDANSYNPRDVINIVIELHSIYKSSDDKNNLPRVYFLKTNEETQELIRTLNEKILESIKNNDSRVSLSYYIEEDGEIFINPLSDDRMSIIYNRTKIELTNNTIRCIGEELKRMSCENIEKVSITPSAITGRNLKLLKILDYTIDYNGKSYCLYKGKWASFNQSYMDYIEKEIVRVNKISMYSPEYNLTDDLLTEGRKIQKDNLKIYDQVKYPEYPYNIFLAERYSYILLDRKKGHEQYNAVEFADLYSPVDESLIHVKIGDTSELRYCIQQSKHSAEILDTKKDELEVYGVDGVNKISMLLVLKSKSIILENNRIDFSKNRSLYLKIEIIEWFFKVRSLGYTPEILIAKDMREVKKGLTREAEIKTDTVV